MKKYLVVLSLFGTLAMMSANADSFLYWMVDNKTTSPSFDFDSAVLIGKNSGDGKDYVLGGADAALGQTIRMESTSLLAAGVANAESWTFFVELYNGQSWVGQSSADQFFSYAAAVAADAIYQEPLPGGAGKLTFTQFTNTPEPTSGLLLLLGTCCLALKRKRV